MQHAPSSVGPAGRDGLETTQIPVVTVALVTQNPGPELAEVLTSLAAQDHPRLRVVVLNASVRGADRAVDVDDLVDRLLPAAEVIPVVAADDFPSIANDVLDLQGRSPFILFSQDHVALAPSAVRLLVEEAVRSNAGIVGPKLVEWSDPRQIRNVGMSVDKTGDVAPYAEPGEFDQEQHDADRDVFAVSADAMLVRSDLFAALDGFDTGMPHRGYDIDLCWRAHAAGARVMIVPDAVGRSGLDHVDRTPAIDGVAHSRRSAVRQLLTNYSSAHTLRVVPQALMMLVVSVAGALAGGRFGEARGRLSAWLGALARPLQLSARRRALAKVRNQPDSHVRRFQAPGFEYVNRRVRQRGERGDGETGRFAGVTTRAASREVQATLLVWLLVVGAVFFGSRSLIFGSVPVINQFGAIDAGPVDLLRSWFGSHRSGGFGSEGFAPTLELLVGLLGIGTFGNMGLLRTVLIIGMPILGALGMYRFMVPFGSLVARLAAPLIYVAVPLGYNALVVGSWRSLILLGGLPWVLRWMAQAAGVPPFAAPVGVAGWARATLIAAVWTALVATWAPVVVGAVGLLLVGVAIGGVFTGRPGPLVRLLVTGLGAVGLAVALHLPWSAELMNRDDAASALTDGRPQQWGELSIFHLLRFETGPHGGVPLGWALIVLAGLALLLARQTRLVWAVRGWAVTLMSVALAWLGQQNDLADIALPEPEVLLTPAAVGVAVAGSMAVVAFERDLTAFGFGWRQALPAVALVALLASFLGGVSAMFDGSWRSPRNGFEIATAFLADGNEDHARVLWIGDADVLPIGSRTWTDDLAFAVTPARVPDVRDLYTADLGEVGPDLEQALSTGVGGGTNRLGSMLGPLGIRWVIVVERIAPPYDGGEAPASPRVTTALAQQLDLEATQVRVGMRVFRNTAWLPTIASIRDEVLLGGDAPDSIFSPEWSGADARPALEQQSPGGWSGALGAGNELYVASEASERWKLTVDGTSMVRSRAFGWANVFDVSTTGPAELIHETPSSHRLALLGQLALWGVVGVIILGGRRRS